MTDQTEVVEQEDQPKSRKRLWIAIAGVVLIALVVGAALFWYFNRTVPEEVSLEGAVAGVTTTVAADAEETTTSVAAESTTTAAAEEETTVPGVGGVEGTWVVDTSIGEFSFEESTASFAGFRVNEELTGVGSAVAVGRTPLVAGTIVINGTTLEEAVIEADLTGIVTNESRRDRRVQSAMGTSEFPVAAFVLTEPVELGSAAAGGEAVQVEAAGDLTIKGVTQPVVIPIEAQLVDDLIVVVGSIDLVFADFNVEVPSAPVVLSADDHGIMEMQLLFGRT